MCNKDNLIAGKSHLVERGGYEMIKSCNLNAPNRNLTLLLSPVSENVDVTLNRKRRFALWRNEIDYVF